MDSWNELVDNVVSLVGSGTCLKDKIRSLVDTLKFSGQLERVSGQTCKFSRQMEWFNGQN